MSVRLACTWCGLSDERCRAAAAADAIKCCPDCRHPAWTGSTALVLLAPLVYFNDGPAVPEIRYRPPGDTTDPRYAACRQHRVACDCREAHMAEDRAEMRSYRDQADRLEQGVDAVLALHAGPDEWGRCSAPGCINDYPCPTRNVLAPLSWRERMNNSRGGNLT